MSPEIVRGHRLVLAVIVAMLAVSAIVIVTFNISRGLDRLPQQIVRFLLTIALCVFLYKGANWARWVTAILCILGGVGSLLTGVALLPGGFRGLIMLAVGMIYIASAVILLFSPSVRAYFSTGELSDPL